MLIAVRSILGVGGVPNDRTAATRWLIKAGVPIMTLEGDARRPKAAKLSDLPAEVRRGLLTLALCRSDEAAFDTFLQKTGPTFGGLMRNHGAAMGGVPPAARSSHRSDAADGICAQLGLPMGSLSK